MRRSQVRSRFLTTTNRKGYRTLYLPYQFTFLIHHEGLTTMRDSSRSNFDRNLAVFIGINNYPWGGDKEVYEIDCIRVAARIPC